MKVLVASDSHGLSLRLLDAIGSEAPDLLLFLGDGVRDLLAVRIQYPELKIEHVRGNCDAWSDGPEERIVQLEGHSILMLHGHTRGVKRGIGKVKTLASKLGVELVLYGHTHRANQTQEDQICLLNPGSIGQFGHTSYGILELTPEEMQCRLTTG